MDGEMTPNLFLVNFKISAEDMENNYDGDTYFVSDPKEKHNSYL